MWDLIAKRNFGESDSGRLLINSHLQFLDELIPGDFLDGLNISMLKFMMGKVIAEDYLGLPKPGWTRILLIFIKGILGLKDELADHSKILGNLSLRDGKKLLDALDEYWNKDKSVPFQIPHSLTKS